MRALGFALASLLFLHLGVAVAGPLSLEDCLRMALERSPTLRAASEAIREADYRKRAALSAFFPRVETRYSWTRLDEKPRFFMPSSTLATPMGPVTVEAREVEVGPRDNYLWSVTVTQPLFTGGALRNAYLLSKLGVDRARLELERVKLELAFRVKEAYWRALQAEGMVEVAQKALESLREHHRVAKAFFAQGMIPRNDLLQVEVELAQREQAVVRAKRGREAAKAVLNTLLRRDLDAELQLQGELKHEPFGRDLQACIQQALKARPEIRAARLAVEMAKKEVKVAASGLYPQLSLVFNYERQGDEPSVSGSRYNPDEESWALIAVLQWRLWDWGGTWWEVKAKRSKVLQAEALLEELQDGVRLEVKEAYLAMREAEKNIRVQEKVLEQASENLRISRERYRLQVATSSEVLDALALLVRARTGHLVALGDHQIARAKLQRAMGER